MADQSTLIAVLIYSSTELYSKKPDHFGRTIKLMTMTYFERNEICRTGPIPGNRRSGPVKEYNS